MPAPQPSQAPQARTISDRPEGAVLLVHGQPGLGSDFDAVAALLADHRLLAPDRPGYGGSGDTPVSMEQNAQLFADLLEAEGAAPATIVGHSYGGGIAILLAARRPDLVSGLVLVSSVGIEGSINRLDHLLATPLIGETLSAAGLYALGRVLPKFRGIASLAPRDLLQRARIVLPDSTYLAVASERGRQTWKSFVAEQRFLLKEIGPIETALEDIRAPTVVLAGAWDVVVPPSVGAAIAAAIRGAELIVVEHVAHFVPRDAPKVVADAVRSVEARATARREPTGAATPCKSSGTTEAQPPI